MSFDLLAEFETGALSDEGVWIDLENPKTGEPLDIRIKIIGGDGEKWLVIKDKFDKDLAAHIRRTKQDTDPKYERSLMRQAVAKAILDWDGLEDECNESNKLELLRKHPWAFDQINRAITDRARFMKGG